MYLNGERVFMRGINYLPTDAYPARTTEERLRADASLVRDANMNAVRVHAHVPERLSTRRVTSWASRPPGLSVAVDAQAHRPWARGRAGEGDGARPAQPSFAWACIWPTTNPSTSSRPRNGAILALAHGGRGSLPALGALAEEGSRPGGRWGYPRGR